MTLRNYLLAALGMVALSTPAVVYAEGELTAAALRDKCAGAASTDREVCQVYLQGFVDGALSTDPKVAVNVANEAARSSETLTERAIRTRVRDRLARYGASVYAEFCPPNPLPVTLLEKAFVSGAEEAPPSLLARELLYDVVRTEFPCERIAQAP